MKIVNSLLSFTNGILHTTLDTISQNKTAKEHLKLDLSKVKVIFYR